MNNILQRIQDAYRRNPAEALQLMPQLCDAIGKTVIELDEKTALAMAAGARATETSKQYKSGATYIYDIFGDHKEITFYESAGILRAISEAALEGSKR